MTAHPAILLLDDESTILDMLLVTLAPADWRLGDATERAPCVVTVTRGEFTGTRFLVAGSAEHAIALAHAHLDAGERLSGGFFDVQLPGALQGPDVMRRLREMQPGLPCTVVTGLHGDLEQVVEVFAPAHLDEWDFMSKPFTRPELLQRCRQMIALSDRRRRESEHLAEIERLNRELELWGRSLEARVAQRTDQLARAMGELREKNDELESVLQALSETQSELVQHEKMATIGQLAAGVARELSRPLAFAQQALAGVARSVERLGEFGDVVEAESSPRPEREPAVVQVRAAFADACRAQRPAAARTEAVHQLSHAAEGLQRAAAIVRELSAFAAPSSAERREVDVSRTLGAAIELMRGSLQRAEILEADLPALPAVQANASELQHAWLQLLRNAMEATAARAGDARITVSAREERGEIVVEFADNGEGISRDLRDRVFEPFFTTRGRKTGLGLSVVHGVVSRHGGRVDVDSAAPCGTTVRVFLPVAVAAATPRAC